MDSIEDLKTSEYEYGLTKIMGLSVKEIHGCISTEFGEPMFRITRVELEDGTVVDCEGEHDLPYLAYNDKLSDACMVIHDEENQGSQQDNIGDDE